MMVKTYYLLTKPGIIMGNLITTAAGFALASRGNFDLWLFAATLIGLGLTIGSACVINNYCDQDADKKMKRTKNRALVLNQVSGQNALLFAAFLGILGLYILAKYTNLLTVLITIAGFFVYVVCYYIWKYKSSYGTLIGSVSGAVPPVIGYCAVSGRFDLGAFVLFLIMVLWQMPHFFAIAIYQFDDYLAASIPVLPIKSGMRSTKIHMLLYIIAFTLAAMTLTFIGYTGTPYMITALVLGLAWLALSIKGFQTKNDTLWAKNMFRLSLVIITLLCLMISIDTRPIIL